MLNSLRSVASLIFPESCIGCERLGSSLCEKCNSEIRNPALFVSKMGINIYAGFRFSPLASKLILAAKENNNIASRNILAHALNRALIYGQKHLSIDSNSKIILIPIPSRASANRSRGYLHTALLARAALRLSDTTEISILNCLEHSRKIQDQSKLNVSERIRNMSNSIVVKQHMNLKESYLGTSSAAFGHNISTVFLIDDLVTTGSTVSAATQALAERGIRAIGAIASCAS